MLSMVYVASVTKLGFCFLSFAGKPQRREGISAYAK
jgi:hypothetical protein